MADKKKDAPASAAQSLSWKDAMTADWGAEHLKEATQKGYAGYVWEPDKSEYTATEVTKHDQTGPDKKAGEYDLDRAMNDHFARGDLLEENQKK